MRAIVGLILLVSMMFIGGLGGGCSVSVKPGNFAEYPQQIQVGTEPARRVYVQKPGYYAVHYAQPEDIVTAEAIVVMDEEAIAVFSGLPGASRNTPADAKISPVYALPSASSLAIPTGRVFVRLAETVAIDSRQDAIQAAGYEIVDRPPYAPHAAWVQARSGSMADALQHISQLTAIPDMANVEPQLLTQRSFR